MAASAVGLCLPEVRMPKRRKTSEQVTMMERTMRTMMIHVMPGSQTHCLSKLTGGREGE